MNSEPQKKFIHEIVLGRIKLGEVAMRPRWHFMLKTAFVIAGIALLALTLLFVVSLALFALRASGVWFVPVFGWHGILVFLRSLPWILVATSFIFIIILELLVRHYSFAYRRPLLYSAFVIIILMAIAGFVVDRISLHDWFSEQAKRTHLPFAERFYRDYGEQQFQDIHVGIVVQVNERRSLTIRDRNNENLEIIITPDTRLPFGSDFQPGDKLVIFGDRDDDTVQALGIRRIDHRKRDFRFRNHNRQSPLFRPRP